MAYHSYQANLGHKNWSVICFVETRNIKDKFENLSFTKLWKLPTTQLLFAIVEATICREKSLRVGGFAVLIIEKSVILNMAVLLR